jgi:hypothetical protein
MKCWLLKGRVSQDFEGLFMILLHNSEKCKKDVCQTYLEKYSLFISVDK